MSRSRGATAALTPRFRCATACAYACRSARVRQFASERSIHACARGRRAARAPRARVGRVACICVCLFLCLQSHSNSHSDRNSNFSTRLTVTVTVTGASEYQLLLRCERVCGGCEWRCRWRWRGVVPRGRPLARRLAFRRAIPRKHDALRR